MTCNCVGQSQFCSEIGFCGDTERHKRSDGGSEFDCQDEEKAKQYKAVMKYLTDKHVAAEDRESKARAHRACCWGPLLDGIDVYAIEMSARAGTVETQAEQYGLNGRVRTVPAITPDTPGARARIQEMSNTCAERAGSNSEANEAFDTSPKVVACTWSHVEALRRACGTAHNDVVVVFEDDTNFAPMEFWPVPLRQMLEELPPSWRVINGAPTNSLDADSFGRPHWFRKNKGVWDHGAVMVIYNLGPPDICDRVNALESGFDLILNARQSCQPADIMLYEEFGSTTISAKSSGKPVTSYTSFMPLVYFTQSAFLNDEVAIHDNDHNNAIKQRTTWHDYSQEAIELAPQSQNQNRDHKKSRIKANTRNRPAQCDQQRCIDTALATAARNVKENREEQILWASKNEDLGINMTHWVTYQVQEEEKKSLQQRAHSVPSGRGGSKGHHSSGGTAQHLESERSDVAQQQSHHVVSRQHNPFERAQHQGLTDVVRQISPMLKEAQE